MPEKVEHYKKLLDIARHPVESSNVLSIGYSELYKVIQIEFHKDGKPLGVYQYGDCDFELFKELDQAESKGKFFNAHIKHRKPFALVG